MNYRKINTVFHNPTNTWDHRSAVAIVAGGHRTVVTALRGSDVETQGAVLVTNRVGPLQAQILLADGPMRIR